ncbi:MAG: hypothetical protein KAS36_09150, partial [Anaerolineales bacterium]|nr:hypothetical protein [Anaerolineales bacterium]
MKNKRTMIRLVSTLMGLLLFTACQGTAQEVTPTSAAVKVEDQTSDSDFQISGTGYGIEVEGRILP